MKRRALLVFSLFLLFLVFVLAGIGVQRRGEAAELNFGFTPTANGWFQTQGGDVHSAGSISSPLPAGEVFSQDLDGYPGVISYGGTSTGFDENSVSSKKWLVQDPSINLARFNYDYFSKDIATSPIPCADPNTAACWANLPTGNYFYEGNLEMPGGETTIHKNKIFLLVDGNVLINKRIKLNEGGFQDGFLAIVAKGNIVIDGSVTEAGKNPALEGVYIADGVISTGSSANTFTGRGVFVGWSGIILGRDLGDGNQMTPAETFIYWPELLITAANDIMKSTMSWTEIAP